LKKIFNKIKQQYPGFVDIVTSDKKKTIPENNCGAGYEKYIVGPSGDVRPCLIGDAKWFAFGNIVKNSPEQIFSAPVPVLFARLKSPNYSTKPCCDCEHRLYCHGCWIRAVDINLKNNTSCQWLKQTGIDKLLNVRNNGIFS